MVTEWLIRAFRPWAVAARPVSSTIAARSVFEGTVPKFVETPPRFARSITAARFPSLAACTAARWPAGPEPTATRSKLMSASEDTVDPSYGLFWAMRGRRRRRYRSGLWGAGVGALAAAAHRADPLLRLGGASQGERLAPLSRHPPLAVAGRCGLGLGQLDPQVVPPATDAEAFEMNACHVCPGLFHELRVDQRASRRSLGSAGLPGAQRGLAQDRGERLDNCRIEQRPRALAQVRDGVGVTH